jgi:hypothetical protein
MSGITPLDPSPVHTEGINNAEVKESDIQTMQPNLARVMFNFGIIVLLMGLIPLPFLDPASPEFIVDAIGLAIDILFLIGVYFDVRRQSSTERGKELKD